MIEPYKGRVYDPACGSGGMFVMSEKFVEEHQGNINDITIYGQESNQTTWKLSKMNLAIRNINSQFVAWNTEGSFLRDVHPDLNRLCHSESAIQPVRVGTRNPPGRCTMEIRRATEWKCEFRMDTTHALSPRSTRSHGDCSCEWFALIQHERRR